MTKREKELQSMYADVDNLILKYMEAHTDLFDVDGFFATIVEFDKFSVGAQIAFGKITAIRFEPYKPMPPKFKILPLYKNVTNTIEGALHMFRVQTKKRVQTKYILRKIKNDILKDRLSMS